MPHSEIHESRLTCSSSWLIAAYRVLLRFETPRHPPYALTNLTYVNGIRYFRFILICLGKSFSVENIVYMSSQYLPCLDFLVSSVQFSVNNKSIINHPINHGVPVDATLKTRQCKTLAVNVYQSRFACARALGTFSQTTCAPIIFALRLDSWAGQPQMPDLRL